MSYCKIFQVNNFNKKNYSSLIFVWINKKCIKNNKNKKWDDKSVDQSGQATGLPDFEQEERQNKF